MAATTRTGERVIRLPSGWRPRAYQRPLWRYLEGGGKRAVAVWHRRAGKDDVALHWTACAAHERPGNYWHMLPEASQARKAIWGAVNPHTGRRRIDEAFPLELRETTRDNDMQIVFKCGSTWQVVGSDNFDSLMGATPCGVVFSEWSIANPMAWPYLQPILEENGGWALWIYTSRGRNHGHSLYEYAKAAFPEWHAERIPAPETGVFSAEKLKAIHDEMVNLYPRDGEARFRQEYHCDFETPLSGAVYGAQLQGMQDRKQIGRVPHDPALPVHTGWDLGLSDATAIWFIQRAGAEIRLIDYYTVSGATIADIAGELAVRAKPPAGGGKGYLYGDYYLPHDAHHKLLAAGGQSIADQLRGLGVGVKVQPRGDLEAGIQSVRAALPRAWIDEGSCGTGLDALRSYRYNWNEGTRDWGKAPVHDWSSHGADALRTYVTAQPVTAAKRAPIQYGRSGVI